MTLYSSLTCPSRRMGQFKKLVFVFWRLYTSAVKKSPLQFFTLHAKKFTFCQVQQWKGETLPPEKYGWKLVDGVWSPEQGYDCICPKEISSLLKCSWKKSCATMSCSCKKSGVDCTQCCKCNEDCENHTHQQLDSSTYESDSSSAEILDSDGE